MINGLYLTRYTRGPEAYLRRPFEALEVLARPSQGQLSGKAKQVRTPVKSDCRFMQFGMVNPGNAGLSSKAW